MQPRRPPSICRRLITALSAALLLTSWANCAEPAAGEPLASIRRLESKHLTLITDLPLSEQVDALPALFDQAFPQWCAYFGVDPGQHDSWHVQGHLMKSRPRFEAAGLIPPGMHEFRSGYAEGNKLWLYDQTSEYYRRHLLLHEGTHAFMHAILNGVGPSWYAEGIAELLATHRLADGQLTLNSFPTNRDEVPKWGRIEIVGSEYAAGRALTLPKVFAFDALKHSENEWYGWCWAAAAFLDGHPRYQARFRQLPKLVGQADFNDALIRSLGHDWTQALEDWQLYVANLDYGYDFSRMEIDRAPGKPLAVGGADVTVAADRGWQNSGVRLEAGKKYRVKASGRYQVAANPSHWMCEPGGVTIRYYRGRPLGMLLGAVRADTPGASGPNGLLKPLPLGLDTTFTAPRDGTLFLRINDSAGELADNAGSLTVEIARE